ncbi:MAG: insulinase family protein [Candidatus Eisenbacteria bacterium]|nr:insulinase family protein [Candidatus Eisenbacteria bacterium]
MKRCALLMILAAFLLAAPAAAQDVAYEKYELENGMTVILHEDHSLPAVCVNIWYHVGAKDEREGLSGFAHLFEHLMFMGTERVPGGDFDEIMEAGGGWNNASTGHDRTNYFSYGPSGLLPTLLWLDADRMEDLGRSMTQEKLDKQRDVVRNEKREGEEMRPYGVAEFEVNRLMYPRTHPYHYDVVGTHEDLAAASLQDVKDFFAQYYVPNNASLVVAGDFDPAEAKPLIQKYFGTIPRGPDPLRAASKPARLAEAKRVVYADDVQAARTYLVYHSPARFGPGDAEMDLAAEVLSTGDAGRLYDRLVREERLATDVAVFQGSLELGSLFYVMITARQGASLDRIEEIADEVIERFREEGPTEEELERHKATYEFAQLNGLQSLVRKANMLNTYDRYFGEPNSFRRDLDRYRKASVEEVRRVVRETLDPKARLVMRVVPESEGAYLAARDERPGMGAAKIFRTEEPETFTLSNGIRVKHWRRAELPLVRVSALFRAGSAHVDGDRPGLAFLTADMLDEGAGDRDAVAFTEALELLGASIDTETDREYALVDLSVLKRNFRSALDLYADALRRPRFDEEEWERVLSIHIEKLLQQKDNPGAVAWRVGQRAFFGGDHPYGPPLQGTEETVSSLTVDDLREAHRRLFAPGNAELYTAGDLTREEAERELERAFGAWENPAGFRPAEAIEYTPPANGAPRVLFIQKEGAPQTVIRFFMPAPRYADPDRESFRLLDTILGGSFTSRLNRNLREEHGYTYGAGSRFLMEPSTGYLIAYSTVQADATGAAIGEFLKEFERMRGGDITAEEALKARETNRMDAIQSFQGLGGLIRTAEIRDLNGLPFSSVGEDLDRIARVGEDELNALAPRSVPLDRALLVLVGDRETVLGQLSGLGLPAPEETDADGDPL